MSACLEFYSVSWSAIEEAIASGDPKYRMAILEEFEPRMEDSFHSDAFGGGPDLDEGLIRLLAGSVESKVAHLGEALAFRYLVEHLGRPAGSLQWAGWGEKVGTDLLTQVAEKHLGSPGQLIQLLSRPIAGFTHDGAPSWGGLSAEELAAVAPRLTGKAPEWSDDLDVDAWLPDLSDALGSAADAGADLVTIYG